MALADGEHRRSTPPALSRRALRDGERRRTNGSGTDDVTPPTTSTGPETGPITTVITRRSLRQAEGRPADKPAGPAGTGPERRSDRRAGGGNRRGGGKGRAGTLVGGGGRSPWSMTVGQRVFGVTTVVGMVLTGAVVVAGNSSAETPSLRDGFAPSGSWAWYNDVKLGTTVSPNQYAQAKVSGLEDGDHNAGFFLRYASKKSRVLVAVSGDGWRIEPQNGTIRTGEFKHSSSGLFRAEIKDKTIRVLWNGGLITTQKIDGTATGTSVIPSIWQSSPTVKMR